MKNIKLILLLFSISIVACTNRDGEIIDLINSIKKQNEDLKAQITALKKTTDSALVAVLKVNSIQTASDKKIDLIQSDLKSLLTQIASLTLQMTSVNADLVSLKSKIDALQIKCAELVAQIALLNANSSTLNDGLVAYYPFNGNANDASTIVEHSGAAHI
jgi:chromosome segregation ATPase